MLSRSPCVYRTLGRSLSAANQVYNLRILPNLSGRSLCSQIVYWTSQPAFLLVPSSLYHCRYFRTSAAYRDELVTINTPFAESITEGDVRWEKAVGDSVAQDEVVCEVETDKTSIQVPTPVAGVIEELLVPDGGRVETGTPLFKLRKTAAPAADAAPSPSAEDVAHPHLHLSPLPLLPPSHLHHSLIQPHLLLLSNPFM